MTSLGTTNTANAEANLTFDGTTLAVTGNVTVSSNATIDGAFNITRTNGSYLINTSPLTKLINNGEYYGELIAQGVGAGTVGSVYFYNGAGTWTATNATTAGNARGLLGIATSAVGFDRGVLIRGFFLNTSWAFTAGQTLYLATSAGNITNVQPSASGNVVRVVGYALSSNEIYFNPSNEWIEIA